MKQKRAKKLLSWVLSMTMLLGLLPTAVFAAEGTISSDETWEDGKVIENAVTIQGSDDPNAPVGIQIAGTVTVKAPITVTGNVLIYAVSNSTPVLRRGYGAAADSGGSDLLRVDTGGSLKLNGITLDGDNSASFTGRMLNVMGSAELVNTTVQNAKTGLANDNVNKSLIYAAENATVLLGSGTEVKGAVGGGVNAGTWIINTAAGSTVKMTGGSIEGNTGFALIVGGAGSFEMTDGKITGNAMRNKTTDVGIAAVNVKGDVTLSGNIQITGNTRGDTQSNLYLANGKTVKANGLTGTVGVSVETAPTGSDAVQVTSDAATASRFTSDAGYLVGNDGSGHVELLLADNFYVSSSGKTDGAGTSDDPLLTIEGAYAKVTADKPAIIHVMNDLTSEQPIAMDADKAVTIQSDAANGAPATIRYTGTQVNPVSDSSIASYRGLLEVTKGTVTLKNLTLDAGGQAICVVKMNGGDVVLDAGAKLTGSNGNKVVNGTASNARLAGGLVAYNGTATMKDGAEISGNTSRWGAAVTLGLSGTGGVFQMDGGTITGNHATTATANDGGVICGWGGRMVMTGGAITGNDTLGSGGAIQVFTKASNDSADNPTLKISGGTIENNSSAFYGGAIHATGGTTIVVSGNPKITGNTNSRTGEASNIYLGTGQYLTAGSLSDAKIGIYTATAPSAEAEGDVKIATGASAGDVQYFYSDNAGEAGVLFCDGTSDTPAAGIHGTHAANTLWLSVAARVTELYVDADNGDDANGGAKTAPLKTLAEALRRVPDGGTIKLLSNVDFDGVFSKLVPENNDKDITITSDPQQTGTYTIHCVGAAGGLTGYAQFYVAGGSSLTLENVTVDGNRDTRQNMSVYGDFFIGPTAEAGAAGKRSSLTLGAGATLQNFYPRAVNVRGNGTVIMEAGSSIRNCEAGINGSYNGDGYNGTDGVGAAVYVCPNGTFDMRGGSITGNRADGYTGKADGHTAASGSGTEGPSGNSVIVPGGVAGVFGEKGATFKMSGAPSVTGNTSGGEAANIFLNNGQTIQLTGALTDGADVRVYVDPMPSAGNKQVVVAEGDGTYEPQASDAAFFRSDKATDAGVSYVESDKTIVLDYDQRSALEVHGIVKDANGNPVAGAKMKVTVATLDGGYETLTAVTGPDGGYTFQAANAKLPGDYTVYADSGTGVASSKQTFENRRPQELADITAAKASGGNTNIVGGVAGDFGKPVAGQAVTVIDKATGQAVTPGGTSQTTTSAGGGYTLENLPDGTYIVQTAGDGKSGMTEIKVSGGQIAPNAAGGYPNANLSVTPGSIVSGTVSGLAAGQTANVSMNVPVYDENGAVIGTKTVTGTAEGPGGYWQIAGVPAGSYPVTVTTPNGAVTGTAAVDQNGRVTAITGSSPSGAMTVDNGELGAAAPAVKPENPNAVTGAVVGGDNKPIENAKVTLYNDKGEKVGEAVTGQGGGYTIPNNLPDGKYYLSADAGGKNGLTGPIEIKNGQTNGKTAVTVSENAGKLLEGTVTKEGGAPASGATVVVKDQSGNVLATAKTNANGQYFVGGVPAGATATIVTPDGETAGFTVGGDGSTWNGDQTTARPASGSKPVIGPDGSKLPVQMGAAAAGKAGIAVTGPNGAAADASAKFEIDAAGNLSAKTGGDKPAPGTYTVTVTDANGMKAVQTVTVNGEGKISDSNPITIAARTVSGKVHYAAGTVPADATVTIPGWGGAKVNTTTGDYQLTGIPDGVYQAVVKVTDGGKTPPVTSEITVTLTVENGAATYTPGSAAATGANVTAGGSSLTVTPTTAVNGILDKLAAARTAIESATAHPSYDANVAAINAYEAAMAALGGASEEELRQLDPAAAKELSSALEAMMRSYLSVRAGQAEGVNNAAAITAAIEAQKGLLIGDEVNYAARHSNHFTDVTLTLKAEDVTAEPTSGVSRDLPKVESVASAAGAEKTALFEIVVEKTTVVKEGGNVVSEATDNVSQLPAPVAITLGIPQDLRGFQYYGVVRVHNGTAERIPSTATATAITFSSSLYSTYAILASNNPMFDDDAKAEQPVIPDVPSGGGGGGGGGGSAGAVQINKTEHGTVSVDKSHASKGQTVTITVTPDKGYTLGSLTVTDKNGNVLSLTDLGNNKFSYIQPEAAPVSIKAVFEKTGGADYASCPKDETCPLYLFQDASPTAWYHDGVHYCLDNGLMNGTSAATFNPNGATTRGMIVTILYRLEGEPETAAASYPDVAGGMYYARAIAWASAHGIVTGYNDGSFGPNNPITREQMAAILYRYATYKGYDVSRKADLSQFTDSGSVSGYAVEALSWANARGLITGTSATTLTPGGQTTRAQAATILMRLCVNIAK